MIAYQTLNPMSKVYNIMNRMHIGEQKDLKAYSARTKNVQLKKYEGQHYSISYMSGSDMLNCRLISLK